MSKNQNNNLGFKEKSETGNINKTTYSSDFNKTRELFKKVEESERRKKVREGYTLNQQIEDQKYKYLDSDEVLKLKKIEKEKNKYYSFKSLIWIGLFFLLLIVVSFIWEYIKF